MTAPITEVGYSWTGSNLKDGDPLSVTALIIMATAVKETPRMLHVKVREMVSIHDSHLLPYHLSALVNCRGVRSLRSVTGKRGMKASATRTAQLANTEQSGIFPVFTTMNCTIESNCTRTLNY